MTYFELYDLPISFKVDKKALKKKFFALSRKYHPDFYTQDDATAQQTALDLSSLNNEAYKVLTDFDARLKYVLSIKEVLGDEGQNKIPQDFLMEMMDINEQLMELEFDFDKTTFSKVKTEIDSIESTLYASIESIIENYDDNNANESELNSLKNYYLKQRYIWRIKKNLSKFATL